MKKGRFLTTCKQNGNLIAVERKGYILEKNYNLKPYYFGIDQRYKGYWYITEITTGMRVGCACRLKDCENEVDKVLSAIDNFFNNPKKVNKAVKIMREGLNNMTID